MNYALTINGTIISGVHEGLRPFTDETFALNPRLATHEVRAIPDRGDYQAGTDIRCYEPDGTTKPLVWCIQQGYMALPPGKEIIDGVLVDLAVPEKEAEPSVREIILGLRSEIAGLKDAVAANAAKIASVELKPVEPIREVKT